MLRRLLRRVESVAGPMPETCFARNAGARNDGRSATKISPRCFIVHQIGIPGFRRSKCGILLRRNESGGSRRSGASALSEAFSTSRLAGPTKQPKPQECRSKSPFFARPPAPRVRRSARGLAMTNVKPQSTREGRSGPIACSALFFARQGGAAAQVRRSVARGHELAKGAGARLAKSAVRRRRRTDR
jgi:hypothetical protein